MNDVLKIVEALDESIPKNESSKLSYFQKMDIAVQIRRNIIFDIALTGGRTEQPLVLEQIGMLMKDDIALRTE